MALNPKKVKSQAVVKIAANQYILMHPETDADIVNIAVQGITATNVSDAIAELHRYIQQITGGGVVTGVKGSAETDYRTGEVNITAANIGLGNVQDLAPADMPISTATKDALDKKADTTGTYIGLTAGAVQAALTFGGKSYNGSTAQTITKEDFGLASAYIPQGSIEFAELPTPSASNLGFVYDVSDAFTTTVQFLEGAGKNYPAGTNVAIVQSGSDYFYDVLGSALVDLSNYATINGNYPNMSVGNVTSKINNKLITDIFEANGLTAKKATSAAQLSTAQNISLTGDATGSASFDGSAPANIAVVLADSGVTAGSYSSVTVDAKGRVTAGAQMVEVGKIGQTEPSVDLAIGGTFYLNLGESV